MNKIKYYALRSLIFVVILLISWFLIALAYVIILQPIFGKSIWEWLIIGGSGYYSLIYANKISARITNRFIIEKTAKEDKKRIKQFLIKPLTGGFLVI